MNQPYRTLFTGVLEQQSSLCTGGNEAGMGSVDMMMARDGLRRFTIQGGNLGGALISTATKVFNWQKGSPGFISEHPENTSPKDAKLKSRWHFFHSHPLKNDIAPEIRQGVGIRQDTGAAADGALFDMESLPIGTEWWFCLEVDTSGDVEEGHRAELYAAAALLEWQRGHCWIGHSVCRGMGWLIIKNLQAIRLTSEHIDKWPDSTKTPQETITQLQSCINPIQASDFEKVMGIRKHLPQKHWCYWEIEGEVQVGQRSDGYGLDTISIGGHAANMAYAVWDEQHYLSPHGCTSETIAQNFAPDMAIVFSLRKDGKLEPFIPGGGWRGPIRHALSRWLRTKNSIKDPNVRDQSEASTLDQVERWFGSMVKDKEKGSSVLVRDAYLTEESRETWQAVWLQQHAEDEFTAGVYATSKFDRLSLLGGTFAWKMVVEIPPETNEDELKTMAEYLKNLAESGHLPLGGGQWRGSGWPCWSITSYKKVTCGEEI